MPGTVGTHLVAQVGFIVKDIEETKKKWAEFLGVDVPPTQPCGDYEITQTVFEGKPAPKANSLLAFFDVGPGLQIELIQPNEEPSTWRNFLNEHGEGMHHLAFQVRDSKTQVANAEAAGLRIYVLTGNHDLDNPNAALFSGAEFQRVPFAESADFRRIYADFGFDEALSIDTDSLSYVVDLNDNTRLLMLDCNTRHDPCGISDRSLEWVEQQLKAARDAGLHVLAAGHQNLFQLTVFRAGYVIDKADRLADLLRQYGVTLYLSGHLHCQHWKTEDGLTEIATSALAVSPCQYGVLTVTGDKLSYQTKETDVSAWAMEQGRTEAELLDFPPYTAGFFDSRNRANTAETLSLFNYTPEEIERMTEYIVRLNRAYFSGDMRDAASFDPDGEIAALFDRTANLYTAYLASVRPDYGMDFRVWKNND